MHDTVTAPRGKVRLTVAAIAALLAATVLAAILLPVCLLFASPDPAGREQEAAPARREARGMETASDHAHTGH